MKINFRHGRVAIKIDLEKHVQRHTFFALASKHSHTNQIGVTLSDINGPRGDDKCCQVKT